jgi:hypothetical protein
MPTRNINMHAFELRDFGKLHKTIPMAAKKSRSLTLECPPCLRILRVE